MVSEVGVVLGLEAFPFPIAGRAAGTGQIARGTLLGLQSLIGMRVDPADPTTDLATFVQARLVTGADVFVTGHSLGGCLASVVAPWLASLQGTTDHLKVYTFAAPSAGDGDFARYYNDLFVDAGGQSTAYRVSNDLDIVPNAWASLPLIANYYQPAPLCTLEIKVLVATAGLAVGSNYVQVGATAQQSAITLHGSTAQATAVAAFSPVDDVAFLNQINQQHAPSTYLRLVQAPT